jgi:MFS family permease
LVLEEWCIVLGIVIAFWITYGTRYMTGEWAWRLPFLLQMIPGFVLAVGVYALPFSPRWLASKGRDTEALESLCRLRSLPASDKRVRQELMDIQAEVRFHQQMNKEKHPDLQGGGIKKSILQELSSWADCFKKGCWRRTHIGIGLGFFQQVSRLSDENGRDDRLMLMI